MGKNKLCTISRSVNIISADWFFVCFFFSKKREMLSNAVKFRYVVKEEIQIRQNPILVGI